MKNSIITINNIKLFLKKLEVFSDKICQNMSSVLKAILESDKLRISNLAQAMDGNFDANYKRIQRLLDNLSLEDLELATKKLYLRNESNIILVDPTEIERPDAKNTEYVGFLKDKSRGYVNIIYAYPYQGRAIPFYFQTYSSKTIADEMYSRNSIWRDDITKLKFLAEKKTIVADREFCSEHYINMLTAENIDFVIRLKVGKAESPVSITDIKGQKINYQNAKKGKRKHWKNVFYKGKIKINLVRYWNKKYNTPLFIITNKDPKGAIDLYKQRMKIEETIRDIKDKLGVDKNMCKTKHNLDKMIFMAFLAYCISVLVGESIREEMKKTKQKQMSGLFILLHYARFIARDLIKKAIKKAFKFFKRIVLSNQHLMFMSYG